MSVTLDLSQLWTPLPTQGAFCDAVAQAARWDIVAYIGAFGSGKSRSICRAGLGISLAHPGCVTLIGRYNATDLKDTTQAEWFTLLADLETHIRQQLPRKQRADFDGLGRHNKGANDYEFHEGFGGARVLFRPLEEAERKYKSLTLGAFGIDEASEVDRDRKDPASVLMLQGRLRQVGMPCVGFLASNPTSFDHWLYRWYGAAHGATVGPKGYPVFRAKTSENAANLPPGYEAELRKSYPPDHVRRYLDGEWGGIDEGLPIFPTFDTTQHLRTLTWHPRRPVHVGIDLGTEAPGVVWAQIETRVDRLLALRSWAPRNTDIYKLAAGIKARTGEWFPGVPVRYYTGHDGGVKVPRQGGPAIPAREVLREVLGVMPTTRFTHKERGFTTMRSLLEIRDDGEPGLLVDVQNPALIDGFNGGYRYDPKHEGEPLKNGIYDPLMDALRYIAVNCFTQGGRIPTVASVPAFRGFTPHPHRASGLEPGERVARRSTVIALRQGA